MILNEDVLPAKGFTSSRRLIWIIGALLATALSIPTVLCYAQGYKLSEVVGEITAYRYFYSLRMAFGQGESPWVPNGHTIGYAYLVLNKLLHFVRCDWHETKYRIDLALVTMNFLSFGLAGWLLVQAFLRPTKLVGALLAALLALGILYQQSLEAGFYTVVPDYQNLLLPMALAAAALGLPLVRGLASWKTGTLIAIYGALCLATKLTFVAFYAPLALLFLHATPSWPRRIAWFIGLGLLPLGGALFILYAYHAFSWDATAFNLHFIVDFLQNSKVSEPEPYGAWLARVLHQHWETASYWGFLAVLTPYLAALATLVLPQRYLSASFFLFSLVGHALIFRRPHNLSFVEVNFYLYVYVLLYVLAWRGQQKSAKVTKTSKWTLSLRLYFPYLLCVLTLVWLVIEVNRGLPQTRARIRECNLTGRQVTAFLQSTPGNTLFLIPNNSYALPTLDSAISKGGTNMHSNTWGDSNLMAQLFPDRTYLFGYSPSPLYDLTPFNKLVFTVILNDYTGDIAKLKTLFGVTLDGFTRTFEYEINSSVRVLGYVRSSPVLEPQRQPLLSTADFDSALAAGSMSGFIVTPLEAKAKLLTTKEGGRPIARIEATGATPYLAFGAADPLASFRTGNVEILAEVRVKQSRKVLLQVHLAATAGESSKTAGKEFEIPADRWTPISLNQALPASGSHIENYSVAITTVEAGETLEIAHLEATLVSRELKH